MNEQITGIVAAPNPGTTAAAPGLAQWLLAGREIAADLLRDYRWMVLHTKSRQEKAVAAHLEARGSLCFLPLVSHRRLQGQRRRRAEVDLPLFPSYVFLFGRIEQAYDADRSKRLASMIPVHDQQRLDWELRNVHLALVNHAPLDPYPYLKKGIRAEVRSGPLRGLQGVIADRLKIDRLVLQVDMLGRAVSIEIDGALLEPLE